MYTQQLESYGSHCHLKSCNVGDFLPFKCQHCSHSFCGEHWRPEQHSCDQYDASKLDYRVLSCALCRNPVSYSDMDRCTDPNILMERHLTNDCPTLLQDGTASLNKSINKSKENRCAYKRCKTILISPIRCSGCSLDYCPTHRAASDHACLASSTNTTPLGKFAPTRSAAQAALSRSNLAQSISPPQISPEPIAAKKSPSKCSFPIPISASARRAKAEQASAAKALQERAKKGLLSKDEEIKYATMQALQHRGGHEKDKKECIVV